MESLPPRTLTDLESLINCKIDIGRSQPMVWSELNSPSVTNPTQKIALSKSTNILLEIKRKLSVQLQLAN